MTVFLVRHASAGVRNNSDANDLQRALDDIGHGQAAAIADHLADEGITAIRSSRALRCTQTLGPLSMRLDLEVQPEPALLEGSSTGRVLEFLRGLPAEPVALCSHGDIIPDAIRALEVGGMHIMGERRFPKGCVWRLERDPDTFISATCTVL